MTRDYGRLGQTGAESALRANLSEAEPVRLLSSNAVLSPAARSLLLSPPPVKPLDAAVAMRVRGAVLQAGGGELATGKAAASQPMALGKMALGKLSAIAAGAALVGAGVTALLSTYVGSPSRGFVSNHGEHLHVSSQSEQARDSSGKYGKYSSGKYSSDGSAMGAPGPAARSSRHHGSAESNLRDASGQASASSANAAALGESTAASLSAMSDSSRAGNEGKGLTSADADSNTLVNADGKSLEIGATVERDEIDERSGAESNNAVLSVDDLAAAEDGVFASVRKSAVSGRALVRPAFRRIASSSSGQRHAVKPPTYVMSSLEEETRLLEDARSKLGRDPEGALSLALKHQSQFRRGQLLEQRRMIHLEALLRLGRDKEAVELAKTIGSSLYRTRALALLTKYGL